MGSLARSSLETSIERIPSWSITRFQIPEFWGLSLTLTPVSFRISFTDTHCSHPYIHRLCSRQSQDLKENLQVLDVVFFRLGVDSHPLDRSLECMTHDRLASVRVQRLDCNGSLFFRHFIPFSGLHHSLPRDTSTRKTETSFSGMIPRLHGPDPAVFSSSRKRLKPSVWIKGVDLERSLYGPRWCSGSRR